MRVPVACSSCRKPCTMPMPEGEHDDDEETAERRSELERQVFGMADHLYYCWNCADMSDDEQREARRLCLLQRNGTRWHTWRLVAAAPNCRCVITDEMVFDGDD